LTLGQRPSFVKKARAKESQQGHGRIGKKLLRRSKRSRKEVAVPYEEEVVSL
jgi:hypothetical protein